MLRVVVDAMVWVSATTGSPNGASFAIYDAWLKDEIIVVTSGPLADELFGTLTEVLKRPVDEVDAFIALLLLRAEVVAIKHQIMGCQDERDNPVLETALTGKAQCIVTRDKKLLNLRNYVAAYYERHGIAIVTPAEFMGYLRSATHLRTTRVSASDDSEEPKGTVERFPN